MEDKIENKVVDKLKNDSSEELINLMWECNISDGVIILTLMEIGSHTECYKVLYNRINKQKDAINDEMVKQEALEIFHEIDRKEDM